MVPLSQPQAHYLFGVMRLAEGAMLSVFDGQNGEWDARVVEANKRRGMLECVEQTKPQTGPPDLWLMFAPIKKARTDFIVEKAVEMGVARILPVLTDFTNAERVRVDRLQAHAVEAAEQCGAVYVPEVAEPQKLAKVLDRWDSFRQIMMGDEAQAGRFAPLTGSVGPWAVLIGPEGGFSPAERDRLAGLDYVQRVALGPRILRADTAAIAALTLWQTTYGDWR
ncbi:Ribosomal RNA small subunit methyltransferase E [Flavimaricola marinus]|uniref:Ribosomal RNA small subunit methyltransferase E n=2 Tax=Flavimaricola marinus TaxID=1819565 RepID=A0A238LD33_9RHOB|nr:Ribosomal RNA small subunit methyltransferase E [Flavimaricola marinus]